MHELTEQSAIQIIVNMLAVALLVLANALFVAAEFALVKVRPSKLREMAATGNGRAKVAAFMAENLDATLSVCQVGITLASLGLGWLGEPAFGALMERLFAPTEPWLGALSLTLSVGSAFFLITFLHVVLGELVPKTVAIDVAERVALAVAWPLRAFWIISWPLVVTLNGTARLILRALNFRLGREGSAHSIDEIRQLVVLSAHHGEIELREKELIENLLRFTELTAQDVMVPRSRVAWIDLQAPLETTLQVVREEEFSRYPLCDGDLEHVLGVLHVKALFRAVRSGGEGINLRKLARRPLMLPGTMDLEALLRRFQADRGHLAIVLDEYGAVSGIVTLEDVLEELVGELRDEFDAEELDEARPRPGGGWILDPVFAVERARELVPDAPPIPEEIHTVAGLMQAELGRLPREGDRIDFGPGHVLEAKLVEGARLLRIDLIPSEKGD